jgi:hypothetical protein
MQVFRVLLELALFLANGRCLLASAPFSLLQIVVRVLVTRSNV